MDEEENEFCRTVFFFDGDNFRRSLGRIGLRFTNLRLFINYFLEENDLLVKMENMEGRFFNPIIYVVDRKIAEGKRKQQNIFLNDLMRGNEELLKLSVIDPKRSRNGSLHSCADAEIASFIAIALYDPKIDKIVFVSGDGDFLGPLKRIGVVNKKIHQIGVKNSISRQLRNHISLLNGKTFVIEDLVPGLSRIDSKGSKKKRKQTQKSRKNPNPNPNWKHRKQEYRNCDFN